MTPLLHVSSRYPASRGCLAIIAPLARTSRRDRTASSFTISTVDPTPLIELDADAIADRVFTRRADLPEGVERIPLRPSMRTARRRWRR